MTSLRDTLILLKGKKRSIVSFNIQNLYQLDALKSVSERNCWPVIAQFSSKYIPYLEKYFGLKNIMEKYRVDNLYFHLDHCYDESIIKNCIDIGFDSIMFDGSQLAVQENIRITNQIYNYAFKKKCLLEAELGMIKGVEDGIGSDHGNYFSKSELITFFKNAKYDLLALAIGNAHGFYSDTSIIKPELLKEAVDLIGDTNLVLHGCTGMPDLMIYESIGYGVVKINVSTELKSKTQQVISEYVLKSSIFDEIAFHKQFDQLEIFFSTYIEKYTL